VQNTNSKNQNNANSIKQTTIKSTNVRPTVTSTIKPVVKSTPIKSIPTQTIRSTPTPTIKPVATVKPIISTIKTTVKAPVVQQKPQTVQNNFGTVKQSTPVVQIKQKLPVKTTSSQFPTFNSLSSNQGNANVFATSKAPSQQSNIIKTPSQLTNLNSLISSSSFSSLSKLTNSPLRQN
jgi:hypothetical protein